MSEQEPAPEKKPDECYLAFEEWVMEDGERDLRPALTTQSFNGMVFTNKTTDDQ